MPSDPPRKVPGTKGAVPHARQMLRELLVDPPELTPFEEIGQKGYRLNGQGSYERLLAGVGVATSSGDPDGLRTRVSAAPACSPILAIASKERSHHLRD